MNEDNTDNKKERKFIPSMSQLEDAAAALPDPGGEASSVFETFVDSDKSKPVRFEKIKLIKTDGTKVVKWSFKGRVFIDSKHISKEKPAWKKI